MRWRHIWHRRSVLEQFTVIGLSITCAIGIVLGTLVGDEIEKAALDQAAQRAAESVTTVLDQQLRPADFDGPLSGARQEIVDQLVWDRLHSSHIVRIRIWSASGQVVYADDGHGVGEMHPEDDELHEALEGELPREIIDDAKAENQDLLASYGRLMEIYVPIRLDGEHAVGAYEVYQDLQTVQPYVTRMQSTLRWGVALAFGVLYLALFGVVRGASRRLRRQEQRFRSLVGNAKDVILILDDAGRIQYQSPAAKRGWGYEPAQLASTDLLSLVHADDRAAAHGLLEEAHAAPGADVETELRVRRADGSWGECEVLARNLLRDPVVSGIVVTFHDIGERKAFERQLRELAFHDSLTGLANRALFVDRLDHAISRVDRFGRSVALLFLDLDNFKVINDSLGHDAGDRLLVTIAERIRDTLRQEDTVARLGGDEFTVLLEDVGDETAAVAAAERIERAVSMPVLVDGREIHPSVSIGIALSVPGHDQHDTLLRNADLAMYRAKANGRGGHVVFDQSMNAAAIERLEIEADLRHALAHGELRVVYQPIVSLETGLLTEVEALVRWEHPRQGLLSPARFIPVAEETGMIVPIGQWVLEESCRQVAEWHRQFGADCAPVVSVNLSARQFQHPDLVEDIARVLFLSRLRPASLELEITESAVMADTEAATATLRQLKELGIQIAIDDFGTGYSSLNYLKQFPVDTLKIDRSFVKGLGHDPNDDAIVRSVIALARALNLSVTGEGVETSEQLEALRALGCDRGQGYHFARPEMPEQIERMLTDRRPAAHPENADATPAA